MSGRKAVEILQKPQPIFRWLRFSYQTSTLTAPRQRPGLNNTTISTRHIQPCSSRNRANHIAMLKMSDVQSDVSLADEVSGKVFEEVDERGSSNQNTTLRRVTYVLHEASLEFLRPCRWWMPSGRICAIHWGWLGAENLVHRGRGCAAIRDQGPIPSRV